MNVYILWEDLNFFSYWKFEQPVTWGKLEMHKWITQTIKKTTTTTILANSAELAKKTWVQGTL